MAREVQNKYPRLCSHDFQKSLTNEVQLPCNQEGGLVHKVSQFGKICSKCTQIIKDSYSGHGDCIVCSDSILQYLADRELCQHEPREVDELRLPCLNDPTNAHDLPFNSNICRKCTDKVRAAFMNAKTCRICEGREAEVIRDLEKVFISPSYSHIKNILALLQAARAPDPAYKNEIESACKAAPRVERKGHPEVPAKMVEEYNADDREEAHISKRYKLYPKCRKHRQSFISVCNSCLVALLNLDCCPYGCPEERPEARAKKEANVKYSETGFLNVYPQRTNDSYFLELFVVKLIEEKARLDRWELSVRKVTPKSANEQKYVDTFPLYASVVAVSRNDFFVCGGVSGRSIETMKPTANAFVLSLSKDRKEFEIIEVAAMGSARSGHSVVYSQERKMVFAVGGYSRETGYLREAEVYSIENRQWYRLGGLRVERARATAVLHAGSVYVFGGLTSNPLIQEVHAERLNYDDQQWQSVAYSGYDVPFTTNATPLSSLLPLQTRTPLLLFGGANAIDKTGLIQKLQVKEKEFQIDFRSRTQLEFEREGCTLGLINEDTLVCFGGVREHEPFLSIDVVKLNLAGPEVQVVYVNDRVQLGSYRSVAREGERFYGRIKEELKRAGLLSEEERELVKEEGLVSAYNCQLLDKLWFSLGKSYVWVPL